MPLPLLLGLITSRTPLCSSQRRLTSPGMSLKSRKASFLFQSGPSVKVKPAPSCSTWASRSTRSYSFSDLASTAIRLSCLGRCRGAPSVCEASISLRMPGSRYSLGFTNRVSDELQERLARRQASRGTLSRLGSTEELLLTCLSPLLPATNSWRVATLSCTQGFESIPAGGTRKVL